MLNPLRLSPLIGGRWVFMFGGGRPGELQRANSARRAARCVDQKHGRSRLSCCHKTDVFPMVCFHPQSYTNLTEIIWYILKKSSCNLQFPPNPTPPPPPFGAIKAVVMHPSVVKLWHTQILKTNMAIFGWQRQTWWKNNNCHWPRNNKDSASHLNILQNPTLRPRLMF